MDELKDFGSWLDEPAKWNGNGRTRKTRHALRKMKADRRRVCTGKYAYDDPYEALREMFALPYRNPDVSEFSLSLYRCIHCDYWHLGTTVVEWIATTPITVPMPGQQVLKFPELKDYGPSGERLTKRNGEPA